MSMNRFSPIFNESIFQIFNVTRGKSVLRTEIEGLPQTSTVGGRLLSVDPGGQHRLQCRLSTVVRVVPPPSP